MATVFNILAIIVMVAVVAVLIRGLVNLMKGGSGSATQPGGACPHGLADRVGSDVLVRPGADEALFTAGAQAFTEEARL